LPTLDWEGKLDALKLAEKVPCHLLEFDSALSCGDADNLIVQGDNLSVMKSLLNFYRGRVKCIYIDPPYNTHSAFEHYDDNFEHSEWLSMMYPRLELLRDFLADDGAIFISVDDTEQAYLKVICDEIFGRNNFVASVIWHKKGTRSNDARWFSDNHDFILVYVLNKENWRPNLLPRSADSLKNYSNPDNDPRGVWQSLPLQAKSGTNSNFEHIFSNGVKWSPPAGRFSAFSHESLTELEKDNRIWFGTNGNNVPRYKKFLSEVKDGFVPTTIWLRDEVGDNQEAKKEMRKLDLVFDTPKPTRLLERILTLATDKNSLVLDAFAGSGTTAHAVINLNNQDGGNRKFILIEEKEYCKTITAERVKRVGGEFKFYRLGAELFDETGLINPAVTNRQLAAYLQLKFTGKPYTAEKTLPLIGIHEGAAYYLLRDKILTREVLETLPPHDGKKIIFGAACRISAENLKLRGIKFLQIPKDIR